MYLYNLSNSPVLISEGPPSIYLDYPCRPAASFLLLLPPWAVCVSRPRLASAHLLRTLPPPLPRASLLGNHRTPPQARGEKGVTPYGRVLTFPSVFGVGGTCPRPAALCRLSPGRWR